MRDNLAPGLYTCFEFDNEVWNNTTPIYYWIKCQNQFYPHNPGGGPQEQFWGYIAAHYMRTVYDTYGPSKRSQWKGLLGVFNYADYLTDQLIGINQYLTDNPSYTMADLFDEIVPNTYYGAHTFQGNSSDFAPATVTMTIANPCVVTFPTNTLSGLRNNIPIKLSTTGSLPSHLPAGTVLWCINISGGNTCNLSLTFNGSAISTLGDTQSGVHTATECMGDISLQWILDSITKFNSSLEPTRYSWFNKQVAQNNTDGSLTGGHAQTDCANGVPAFLASAGFVSKANANGLGMSSYEGGNGTFLYGFGNFVQDNKVSISVGSPGVVKFSGAAPANGTPVSFNLLSTGTLPGNITSGAIVYIINSSGLTSNVSTSVGGSAINTTGSTSGTIVCKGAYAEFWAQSINTAEDAAVEVAMFENFNALSVNAGAAFPSKYADVQIYQPNTPGATWGALQYLGNGCNDDTPAWDAIKTYNQS